LTEDRRKILDRVKDIWLYVLPRVCEVSRLRVKKREWQYHLSHETGCMESIRPGEEKQKRPDLARRRCGSLRGDVRQPRSHRSTTARRPIHRRRMCAVTLLGKSEDENVRKRSDRVTPPSGTISCAQTAHDNCTRMLGLLRASRTTGGSPSFLGQYTPSSRYPKIITLPKDTPRKWRPQSFNSVSQIAEREDLGLFPRQSYSRLG